MYTQIAKEDLLKKAHRVKNYIITTDFDESQLIDLANSLKERKDGLTKIYWIDGANDRNYPSTSYIKKNPRFVIMGGKLTTESDGLIFPQSEPIVLIIANFNKLKKEDQEFYLGAICKREEHDYYPHNYLHDESIIILDCKASEEEPSFSYKFQVRKIT